MLSLLDFKSPNSTNAHKILPKWQKSNLTGDLHGTLVRSTAEVEMSDPHMPCLHDPAQSWFTGLLWSHTQAHTGPYWPGVKWMNHSQCLPLFASPESGMVIPKKRWMSSWRKKLRKQRIRWGVGGIQERLFLAWFDGTGEEWEWISVWEQMAPGLETNPGHSLSTGDSPFISVPWGDFFRLWESPMENLLRQFKGTFRAFCPNHAEYSRVQMDESSTFTQEHQH